jgi:cytochrome P450
MITRPEDIQAVVSSPHCINKPYIYDFVASKQGLVASSGHLWRNDRKLLSRAFTLPVIRSFLPIFNKNSKLLIGRLDKLAGDAPVNIHKAIDMYALESVLGTTLNIDASNIGEDRMKMYYQNVIDLVIIMLKRVVTLPYHLDVVFDNISIGKRLKEIRNFLDNVAKDVLVAKITEKKNKVPDEAIGDDDEFRKPQIFIDKLLEIDSYTESQMLDHIDSIILGGSETTAVTIANTVLALAMHPDIQEKLFNEVVEIFPDRNQPIDCEMVQGLEYTEMVLKETLRLLPITHVVGRTAEGNIQISQNRIIAQGMYIAIYMWYTHRDKSIWGPDAEKFNPDNFLPENVKQRHPYSYLPFALGPRNCIGMKYAIFSMKTSLAHLVRNYKFRTQLKWDELKPMFGVVMKLEGDYLVTIERRH